MVPLFGPVLGSLHQAHADALMLVGIALRRVASQATRQQRSEAANRAARSRPNRHERCHLAASPAPMRLALPIAPWSTQEARASRSGMVTCVGGRRRRLLHGKNPPRRVARHRADTIKLVLESSRRRAAVCEWRPDPDPRAAADAPPSTRPAAHAPDRTSAASGGGGRATEMGARPATSARSSARAGAPCERKPRRHWSRIAGRRGAPRNY